MTEGNCSTTDSTGQGTTYDVQSFQWWYCFLGACLCLIFSGLASGVNIGLMSLSPLSLRLLVDADPADKRRDPTLRLQARRAGRVLPLLSRKHIVLVTLLLTTAIADEVLPLFIDAIAPTWVAVVVSVSTMLLFTEVIPTAMFTDHRSNLKLAAALAPLVWMLIALLGVVTWPMAKLLTIFVERTHKRVGDADSAAGSLTADEVDRNEEPDRTHSEARQFLKLSRFTALLRLLKKEAITVKGRSSNLHLTVQQVTMLENVAALSTIRAVDCMEPLKWPRLLDANLIGAPWREALAIHATMHALSWFVVEGLHGANTWQVFDTQHVMTSSSAGTLVEALLDCCPAKYQGLCVVGEGTPMMEVDALRRTSTPNSSVVLVSAGSEPERVVGVLHVDNAIKITLLNTTRAAQTAAPAALTAPTMQRAESRRADVHAQDSDSEDDDVSALLNAPRMANAIPWSIKYTNASFA